MPPLLRQDIELVFSQARQSLRALQGSRVFITGGTGFFGRWIIESLLAAEREDPSGLQITVLSRDPTKFRREMAHLQRRVTWVIGGILDLDHRLVAAQTGSTDGYDYVIHLVTEADLEATRADPLRAYEVIARGTQRALEFAEAAGAKRFLFTSSGAVYGRLPPSIQLVPETFNGAPDPMDESSPYSGAGNAKRYAELLCSAYNRSKKLETVVGRCFTFVGPHLPLAGKFAIGNFLSAVQSGEHIVVKGDGTPIRSYLYAADLTIWLLTLLTRGASGRSYNVGSEVPISIGELAHVVAQAVRPPLEVRVLQQPDPAKPVDCYVPSTARAREELGLVQHVSLEEAVDRTLSWLRQ
jgi:nucleoside-diphosphate-sugar epimerase